MDAVKRLDRYGSEPRRNKAGKPINAILTDRKLHLVKIIADHRTLNTDDLHTVVGGSRTHLYEALRDLRSLGLIRKIPAQVTARNRWQKDYHELTPRGVECLNDRGTHAVGAGRIYNLPHTALTSHILSSITAGVSQYPNAKLVSWEALQNHPKFPPETGKAADNTAIPHPIKGSIRPDTHPFAIALPKDGKMAVRFLVIEADNGTETIYPNRPREYKGNSIYAKFEAYLDFIQSKGFHSRYGWPNYFVLFVFTSQQRLENAMTLLGSMSRDSGSRFVLFQLANQNGEPGYIFNTPCERVGFDPLQLNQP